MRKLGLWGSGAVLLLALGLAVASAATPPAEDDDDFGTTKCKPAAAAGPDPAARPRDGWNPFLSRLFGQGEKKPAPKSDNKDKDEDKKADTPAPRAAAAAETAARYRALEDAKLRRRQDVCLRLREIARETHDDDLERKALQLDQLAFEVNQERILKFAGGPAEAEPLEEHSTTDPKSTASTREVKP